MEGLEKASFEIISHSGQAKADIMEAIECSRDINKSKDPQPILDLAKNELKKAQEVHLKVLSLFSETGENQINPLYMHAEDQMITAESFLDFATELIKTNLELFELKKKLANHIENF